MYHVVVAGVDHECCMACLTPYHATTCMPEEDDDQTVTLHFVVSVQCEGKEYDEKSDIWALGCILYEMACLQKTFEGSNLPALVNKIMKVCNFSITL